MLVLMIYMLHIGIRKSLQDFSRVSTKPKVTVYYLEGSQVMKRFYLSYNVGEHNWIMFDCCIHRQ